MKIVCKFPNGFPYGGDNRVEFYDIQDDGMSRVNITHIVAPILIHWWMYHCKEETHIIIHPDQVNNHMIIKTGELYTIKDFLDNVSDVYSDVRLWGHTDKKWHELNDEVYMTDEVK